MIHDQQTLIILIRLTDAQEVLIFLLFPGLEVGGLCVLLSDKQRWHLSPAVLREMASLNTHFAGWATMIAHESGSHLSHLTSCLHTPLSSHTMVLLN